MLRRRAVELTWVCFAVANLVAMAVWPNWETIPFHFVWISLTLVYGFRVWRLRATTGVLLVVIAATGTLIADDALNGDQLWGELFEVPLMSAMFVAMVWHARRRQEALQTAERRAEENASLLEQQERFLQDVSHELRTPVTIARGHLEVLRWLHGDPKPEVTVALDELERIEQILERLLLLAKTGQPDFIVRSEIELETFLEDVFFRWSEIAPRVWRLGKLPTGVLRADAEALRIALDALLENAVKYTERTDAIEHRFTRADAARTRAKGVGLGLSIVDAIAKAHGGACAVRTVRRGSIFSLRLPGFQAATALALARRVEQRPAPTRSG